jgi:hypothetical protein
MRLIPESVRREQLTELLAADGYTFVDWDGPYKGSRSRVKFTCTKHGDCTSTVNNMLTRNARCWKCGHESMVGTCRTPADQAEQVIREKASSVGHTFVNWIDGKYRSQKAKCTFQCDDHGVWVTTMESFMMSSNGCPGCKAVALGDRRRIPENERFTQINELAVKDLIQFEGWLGDYNTGRTRIRVICTKHGEWNPTIEAFVDQQQRCPGCAKGGYDRTKTGYAYALRSECGKHVKVGISNNVPQRIRQLRRDTPFAFIKVAHIRFANGKEAPEFERLVHGNFVSSGFTGFQGCTEWVRFSPDILTWFELSNGVVDATHVQ